MSNERWSRKRWIVMATCFSLALVVSLVTASNVRRPMNAAEPENASSQLFAQVDALRALPRLTPAAIEPIIRMHFTAAESAPPPAARIFIATAPDGPYTTAEVRVPTDLTIATDGMVILDLRPPYTITAADVLARYGDATSVLPPSPHAPPNAPAYYRYQRENANGILSFGIREKRVVSVILDRFPE